ncbi:MAG: hypothetical protein IPP71_08555 [Bacteroidetes bacterium]|nr:hypothetical protein [Bacteroidota bacterium]
MKINFTDFPTYFSVQEYDAAITKMVDILSGNKDILSIFQVGGVSSPGISDIDFYVIFKNECQFLHNPVANLTFPANYFFSHRLFGTCEKFAVDFEKYTFFRSYKLLAGQNINMLNYDLNESDIQILQHQIALEYLIKAWLNISISLIYKEVKVRDLLLHARPFCMTSNFSLLKMKSSKE